MKQILFNLTVIGLLVFLSACNLPAGTPASAGQASPAAPTTSAATPAVAPTEAPSTQEPLTFYEEIPSPPDHYLDVLNQRIDEGTWTREEGLVTLLKLFASEIAFSETGIDASTLLETEGSGVVAVAIEYLQNGTDEATKTEITRLLNLIVPTPESLLRYSQVDTSQGHSTLKMASPSAQTPDCAAFWRAGFPDNRTSSFPCFLANSQTIGGNSYKVFFPAAWMTDETRRRYYDLTRQAIADSIPVMQRYGQMRSIYFVFTYLADPEYPITGMAITYTRGFRPQDESCPVVLFPVMLNLSNSSFQQAIAHEIFHCFAAFNLPDQEHGASYESASWWVEGSAQYFSNLVYPRADMEHLLDNRQMANEMRIIMNGKGSARYTATETTLFTSDSVINLQFQVKLAIDGVLVDAPVNFPIDQSAFSGAPTEGASQYLCQGNLLIVQTPAPDRPALIYSRIAR